MEDNTIAAIATAMGQAGISVIRISGEMAFKIGEAVSGVHPAKAQNLQAKYTRFLNPKSGETLDDGLVLYFKAPNSYTGEDVVELQGHGGRIPSERLLKAALDGGASPAAPGEFTRRAFLNGKIDLTRAEAVMDFIGSQSETAATLAHEQLEGRLSSKINHFFDEIVTLLADVEHLLDFDENEISPTFTQDALLRIKKIKVEIEALLHSYNSGHLLREGALVVILGEPNVGKSSLLNTIIGKNRAIVSNIPGTTRDSIEESVIINGVQVRLIDTAGLRTTADCIEAEGVRRAEEFAKKANLILRIYDSVSKVPTIKEDDKRIITVINKADLITASTETKNAILVSARTGFGINTLLEEISARLDITGNQNESMILASARHHDKLQQVQHAISESIQALELGDSGLVFGAAKLHVALQNLGEITGRIWNEELLDTIFGKFCVGK